MTTTPTPAAGNDVTPRRSRYARRAESSPGRLATWEQITPAVPDLADVMVRYIQQVAVLLRPGTVKGIDLDLRSFATYLIAHHPHVRTVAAVDRPQIEGYKPWLAARTGMNRPTVSPATIAHRLGTLRMFFIRIDEWGWPEAPPRVPMFHGDVPKQHHALPKALDDASAAALLNAAKAQKRRPRLVELLGAYRSAHVPPRHDLLIPRENGRPLDRHTVTRLINKAGAAVGLPHIHPHQLRHTLATQAINRGMSLEAIAAMLGHKSLDMTLVYAKIANRTVAEVYFTVAAKVDALYTPPTGLPTLPGDALGPNMTRLNREHHRLLGNGYCVRPTVMGCEYETICETCTFFQTSIEFRPTLLAQRDDACAKGQTRRAAVYDQLLTTLDTTHAS